MEDNNKIVEKAGKTEGIVAFILSLVGIWAFAIIMDPLAIYFANKSLKLDKDNTFAKVGRAIAIISLSLFVVLFGFTMMATARYLM